MVPILLSLCLAAPVHAAPTPWWVDGVEFVEGIPADVPLLRGAVGEGRPLVVAKVGSREVLAIVDLLGDGTRIGVDLARDAGIATELRKVGGASELVATLPELRLGDVVLRGVRARVVAGYGLTLGVSTWDELGVGILPSEGVVRFVTVDEGRVAVRAMTSDLGAPRQSLAWKEHGEERTGNGVTGRVVASVGELVGMVHLRTDEARSRVEAGRFPLAGSADGQRWAALAPTLGDVALPEVVAVVDGSLADPDPDHFASLGNDALAGLDLMVAGGVVGVSRAEDPRWTYADPVALAHASARYDAWSASRPATVDRPARMGFGDAMTSSPSGDPGRPADAALLRELAAVSWAVGAPEVALRRSLAASEAAGDRCEAHLELGERRLRTSGHQLDQALVASLVRGPLTEAASMHDAWVALTPEQREEVRQGASSPDHLSIEQPDECARASLLELATFLPTSPAHVAEATVAERIHLAPLQAVALAKLPDQPEAAEALLRRAMSSGREEPSLRLALAVAQGALGRDEPAAAWLAGLPYRSVAHPLTAALIGASVAPTPPGSVRPTTGMVASWVVFALRGGAAPPELDVALRELQLRSPGDPSVVALAAVRAAARGEEVPALDGDHLADVWAARAVVAHLAGDLAARDEALRQLRWRYPEWPIGDLGLRDVRVRTGGAR